MKEDDSNDSYPFASNPLSYAHHLYENGKEIIELVIPDDIETIKPATFYGAHHILSLTIPNSVSSIGAYAFCGCRGLTSVVIPNSVTTIENNTFSSCIGLISVIFGNSLKSISWEAFSNCSELMSIIIPNSVTIIGNESFMNCKNLKSVFIGSGVNTMSYDVFRGCTELSSIAISSDNPIFDSRDGCNAIIRTSDNTLLYGCKNSTIPNSVTAIGADAFSNCKGLISVYLPSSIRSIGADAFDYCSNLKEVTIESSPTINVGAFGSCQSLETIRCKSINPPIMKSYSVFNDVVYPNTVLLVPNGAIDVYKSTDWWNRFVKIKGFIDMSDVTYIGPTSVNLTPNIVGNDNAYFSFYGEKFMTLHMTGLEPNTNYDDVYYIINTTNEQEMTFFGFTTP